MVELFDADLKRKGFDGVALPAGSYELHKINGTSTRASTSWAFKTVTRWC